MKHIKHGHCVNKSNHGYPGLHDNPWLCDCQISMVRSLSMSLGSPVVLMDQLLRCRRSLGQSGMLLTQTELSHCMRPSVQPAATRVISPLGSDVILRCDATGYPTPTLSWIKTSAYTGKHWRVTLWWLSNLYKNKSRNVAICFVFFTECCQETILETSEQLPKNLESCKCYLFLEQGQNKNTYLTLITAYVSSFVFSQDFIRLCLNLFNFLSF